MEDDIITQSVCISHSVDTGHSKTARGQGCLISAWCSLLLLSTVMYLRAQQSSTRVFGVVSLVLQTV